MLVVYFANLAWVLGNDLAVYYSSRSTMDVSDFPALGTKLGTYPSDLCKFLPYMAMVPRIWNRDLFW